MPLLRSSLSIGTTALNLNIKSLQYNSSLDQNGCFYPKIARYELLLAHFDYLSASMVLPPFADFILPEIGTPNLWRPLSGSKKNRNWDCILKRMPSIQIHNKKLLKCYL
jgi:hypothetical protein